MLSSPTATEISISRRGRRRRSHSLSSSCLFDPEEFSEQYERSTLSRSLSSIAKQVTTPKGGTTKAAAPSEQPLCGPSATNAHSAEPQPTERERQPKQQQQQQPHSSSMDRLATLVSARVRTPLLLLHFTFLIGIAPGPVGAQLRQYWHNWTAIGADGWSVPYNLATSFPGYPVGGPYHTIWLHPSLWEHVTSSVYGTQFS